MEGGGWERPLEEKVDLERHVSGETQFVLVCNVGFSRKKCLKLFAWSSSTFYQGLNPAEKLPSLLSRSNSWSDVIKRKTQPQTKTGGSIGTKILLHLLLPLQLWTLIWSENWDQNCKLSEQRGRPPTQLTRQGDLLVWNFCYTLNCQKGTLIWYAHWSVPNGLLLYLLIPIYTSASSKYGIKWHRLKALLWCNLISWNWSFLHTWPSLYQILWSWATFGYNN